MGAALGVAACGGRHTAAPAAEVAAVHVDATVADEAADELAADSDLDGEESGTRAEEEAEIESPYDFSWEPSPLTVA